MRRIALMLVLSTLLLPLPATADQLLLDLAAAPLTLKGAWIHNRTGARNDIVLRIEAIQPDGTFTGRLDFYNSHPKGACKAIDEPITEGRMTDAMLRVSAKVMNPNECPNFKLVFRTGGERYLEGKTARGDRIWLDAPK